MPTPTPFSSQDLARVLDARSLTRGRGLVLADAVTVQLDGATIVADVREAVEGHRVRITPGALGRRVVFDYTCTCGGTGCAHVAATAFAALDRFPALRRPEQQSFLDTLVTAAPGAPEPERQRTVFELSPATPPHACAVATLRIGERSGTIIPTTPARIAADPQAGKMLRDIAGLLGGGDTSRIGVPPARVATILGALSRSGQARWHVGGQRLLPGMERMLAAATTAALPAGSAIIRGETGPWYVDAASGAVGPVRVRPPAPPPRAPLPARPTGRGRVEPLRRRADPPVATEQVIVERAPTPVLHLTRLPCPDERGRMQQLDALRLDFDYDGAIIPADDDRQFVRVDGPEGPVFVRRDRAAEAAALEILRQDGFVQMRMADARAAKGRLVFVLRGRDAAEGWQRFVTERLPALQAGDWRSLTDPGFGPRVVGSVGAYDMRIADAPQSGASKAGGSQGNFSLDFGIEIDGVRHRCCRS